MVRISTTRNSVDDADLLRHIAIAVSRSVIAHREPANRKMREENAAKGLGFKGYKTECILASAVANDVFRRFGFRNVKPTALDVFAFNAETYSKALRGETLVTKVFDWGKGWDWKGPLPDGYPNVGHVGVVVDEVLVDITAGQLAAPEEGRFVADTLVLPLRCLPGPSSDMYATVVHEQGPTYLLYRLEPESVQYLKTDDWNDTSRIRQISDLVIEDLLSTGLTEEIPPEMLSTAASISGTRISRASQLTRNHTTRSIVDPYYRIVLERVNRASQKQR